MRKGPRYPPIRIIGRFSIWDKFNIPRNWDTFRNYTVSAEIIELVPACCFFFLLTAADIRATRSSSLMPLRSASRRDTSVFPNKQTWNCRDPIIITAKHVEVLYYTYFQITVGRQSEPGINGQIYSGNQLLSSFSYRTHLLHVPQKWLLIEVINPSWPAYPSTLNALDVSFGRFSIALKFGYTLLILVNIS